MNKESVVNGTRVEAFWSNMMHIVQPYIINLCTSPFLDEKPYQVLIIRYIFHNFPTVA